MLSVPCYAKINLGLHVLGLRADGYHELRTVFQTISLHDTLEVSRERGTSGVDFECDVPELSGPENLAARAAALMCDELKLRGRIRLRLRKRIPWGAGLGGGSSDAAAALRAVAQLAGRKVPRRRLFEMAAQLGADVPFFLAGGTALGIGRGTEVYPLAEGPARPLLVVYPPVSVNTRAAYLALDRLTAAPEPDKIFSFCASLDGLPGVRGANRLENDFEQVVFSTYPQIARLKRFLLRAGAFPALLSGSGSAVYGFFESRRKAEQAGKELLTRYPRCRVWVVNTVSRAMCERKWKPIG